MKLFVDTFGMRKRKKRPHGQLPSRGKYKEMLKDAEEMAHMLSKEKGVIGITLGGGISRGYADDLSEIDLNIYLENKVFNDWVAGKAPIPQGDMLWEGKYFDIAFLLFSKEREKEWDILKKWDASYNVILFDPQGRIAKLLEEKDVFTASEKYKCAFTNYLDCAYIGDFVITQWIKRGDPLVANQLINKAIFSLVQLVFLANDEYPPFEKWALNYSHSLKWLPKDWKERIASLILVKGPSFEEAERRRKELMALYQECWEKIVGKERKEIGLIELKALEELQFIVDNSPIAIEEFKKRFDLKHLSYEPLFKLTRIITEDNEELIIFDREKFIKENSEGFPDFLDWNKELLQQLKLNEK